MALSSNPSYIGENQVAGWASASILMLFLLAINEFGNIIKLRNLNGYSTSLFGILSVLVIQLMISILDFTPTEGLPFLIIGVPVLASYLLLLGDLPDILSVRASKGPIPQVGNSNGDFHFPFLFLTLCRWFSDRTWSRFSLPP